MRQCDRFPLSAVGYRLSAVGYRLSAVGYRLTAVRWAVFPNAGDIRLSDIKHQTYFIPDSKRVQAPSAPGFYRSCASHRTMGSARRAGWFLGNTAYGSENLHNRAGARWKCTPFGADAPPFPRRGNFSCRLALGLMSTTKYHAAKISPSGGDVAAGDRRGAFPMWRPCRGSPSRAKLVPGLHIKGLSNKSPDRCRRHGFTVLPPTGGIINSLPLKGKRLTTFCVSLTLLHPLLSLTHWIFRSLTLPYKSSSHSAKCVRCAPQSGNPQPSA